VWLVYDSHELQVQRHRRAGWLRVLLEHEQEQRVVAAANEVRTVNLAVAQLMQKLHPTLSELPRVVTNDLYAHREVTVADTSLPPALVYVGRATRGRTLERLHRPLQELGFEVHGWLLGPPTASDHVGNWRHDARSYEDELAELARRRRCLMWCCVDTGSLSYRLATPNKLFQALALGIPSVVSPGTYLAELVQQVGIGVVDSGDLPHLAERVRSSEYVTWVENVLSFRARLRASQPLL
jgi:glycosyltransferase involved in cell wall biosynthesis